MKELKRYVFIDGEIERKNDFLSALEQDDNRWVVCPSSTIEYLNDVKTKDDVESIFVLTREKGKFHNMVVSNNIIDVTDKKVDCAIKEMHWIMKDKKTEGRIFFTSDTHFSHKNIIKYCNRPWNSGFAENGEMIITDDDVNRMNEDLINNWNSVVSPDDTVYHLGDFALGNRSLIPDLVSRLNGKINLILGNHDWFHIKNNEKYTSIIDFFYKAGFQKVYDKPILLENYWILSHEPMMFLNENCPFGSIFGHVHDSSSFNTFSKNSCCVCVERHQYKPIAFETIKSEIEKINT